MYIAGQHYETDTQTIIEALQSVGTGFESPPVLELEGDGISRGESPALHAKLRAANIAAVKAGIHTPMEHNLRPVAPDAHRVEGSEVGFSDKDPIGTDNVHDCVCVLLRNPSTNKTALAHIGGDSTKESLQAIWDAMGDSAGLMQMRLIGGRQLPVTADPTDGVYPYQIKGNQIARWNVEKVVDFFKDKPVNVLSADILQADQPAVVVVDPTSPEFTLFERVPGRENPEAKRVNALGVLHMEGYLDVDNKGVRPLHVAFDLTKSPERNPLTLTRDEVRTLREKFLDKSPEDVKAYCLENNRTGLMLEQAMERAGALCDAYRSALNPLQKEIDYASAASKQELLHAARDMPLSIGEHADAHNASRVAEIRFCRQSFQP